MSDEQPEGFHQIGWFRSFTGDDTNWHPMWEPDPAPVTLVLHNPDGTTTATDRGGE